MMDARTQRQHAAKLEGAGPYFYRIDRDTSGNRVGVQRIPWLSVVARCMAEFGWGMADDSGAKETPVIPMRRDG